jgi:hypothetical protein
MRDLRLALHGPGKGAYLDNKSLEYPVLLRFRQ